MRSLGGRPLFLVLTAVALLCSGHAAAQERPDTASVRAATAEVNGIEIHYRTVGNGPPLLLHGFSGAGSWWDPLLEDLADDHTLIIPDLPLHGRSTGRTGAYRFEDVATDLYALMDELGIGRFRAAGYSGGGIALTHMLTQQPNRIESAVLLSAPGVLSEAQILAFPSFEDHSARVRDYWLEAHPGGEPQVRRLITSFHALSGVGEEVNVTPEQLSTIKARTLLIVGDRDPVVPLELALVMYRAIPDAALWVIPGQGHSPVMPDWGGSPEARRIFPDVVENSSANRRAARVHLRWIAAATDAIRP